jgi:hypothetical protein
MASSVAALLHDWHDFYILVGTASATLVGLMFVAVSIGSSIFNEEKRASMGAFITPTVLHFACVLFACLIIVVPTHSWCTLGGVLGFGGIFGLIYCSRILSDIVIRQRFKVDLDLSDRLFYALIPLLGYLLILISAVLLLMQSPASVDLIAVGLLTLLLAGIRNAWDMMVWIVIRASPPGVGPSPP